MSGIANSLIALLELRAEAAGDLTTALATLDSKPSPFSRVTGTHFARWAHVEALPGPDGPLDGPAYLLMCADFDPPLTVWAHVLCEQAGPQLDAVMETCIGWPGSRSPRAVASFLARHHTPAGFTVSTYRRATVREVRQALALRRSLRALAVRAQAQSLDASALRGEWRRVAEQ